MGTNNILAMASDKVERIYQLLRVTIVGADRRDAPLYKIGCTSAIKASFIAFGLHYPSQTANFFEGRI